MRKEASSIVTDSVPPAAAITLEEFIVITNSCEDSQLSYKARTTLALKLASSVLQLSDTPWLVVPLTKSAVQFFPQESSPCSTIDASRPTIAETVHKHQAQCQTGQARGQDPKAVFLGLGPLLLEIWHHETFKLDWLGWPSNAVTQSMVDVQRRFAGWKPRSVSCH